MLHGQKKHMVSKKHFFITFNKKVAFLYTTSFEASIMLRDKVQIPLFANNIKETQKLVCIFIDAVIFSFGSRTDKQIKSSAGQNPVSTSVGKL